MNVGTVLAGAHAAAVGTGKVHHVFLNEENVLRLVSDREITPSSSALYSRWTKVATFYPVEIPK